MHNSFIIVFFFLVNKQVLKISLVKLNKHIKDNTNFDVHKCFLSYSQYTNINKVHICLLQYNNQTFTV